MNVAAKKIEVESDRAAMKEFHLRIRNDMHEAARTSGSRHRTMLLLWGFVREFPYRRIERNHHKQIVNGREFEHNMPYASTLLREWRKYLPEITEASIREWLRNPDGAIPAPPPREKKPYVKPE